MWRMSASARERLPGVSGRPVNSRQRMPLQRKSRKRWSDLLRTGTFTPPRKRDRRRPRRPHSQARCPLEHCLQVEQQLAARLLEVDALHKDALALEVSERLCRVAKPLPHLGGAYEALAAPEARHE